MKLFLILISLLAVFRLDGAMVRVVSVQDGRTLVVERNGVPETVQLAGIVILDELRAVELLRWSVATSWVLLEPHARGGSLVWRSPDALFVNRELVLRGYARATEHGIEPEQNLQVTYLGQIDPPAPPITTTKTRSSTSTRQGSPATPKQRSRASASKAPARARSSGSRRR